MGLTAKRLSAGRYVIEDADGGRWQVRRANLAWVGTTTALGLVTDELEADSLDQLKQKIAELAEARLRS